MNGIRSLRTGIMEEYPVMSTSKDTCVRIEQTSEVIRVTYEMCRAGGARTGIENRWCSISSSFQNSLKTSGHRGYGFLELEFGPILA